MNTKSLEQLKQDLENEKFYLTEKLAILTNSIDELTEKKASLLATFTETCTLLKKVQRDIELQKDNNT